MTRPLRLIVPAQPFGTSLCFSGNAAAANLVREGHLEAGSPGWGRSQPEPRSLLVLSDEGRYDWEHGIAPRKSEDWHGLPVERRRRLSVTFRFLTAGSAAPEP